MGLTAYLTKPLIWRTIITFGTANNTRLATTTLFDPGAITLHHGRDDVPSPPIQPVADADSPFGEQIGVTARTSLTQLGFR